MFPRPGDYALDSAEIAKHPRADVEIAKIAELVEYDLSSPVKKK